MKKFAKFALAALACLAFGGCAALQSQKTSDKFIVTILTPLLKINDVGFLHKSAKFDPQTPIFDRSIKFKPVLAIIAP